MIYINPQFCNHTMYALVFRDIADKLAIGTTTPVSIPSNIYQISPYYP